ncbi:lipoprotein-anchoring transpeptidase ErfK/SrfK [Mycolicibacterium fluoranthenivorans]|uniref:Lipoprotein-anchoring transpeptidase ErfK/SrfK n=2 Tax=Mycolicibacterium fluoranthenivorans TaxID=258505 RepID=A0A7X5U0Y8_9MYCO|nr:L,D-transpeptidase [Mycolicibacterium fluoranthenivorans]NIH96390.1 lipoprotein-anchoring transpeptidase ErfK/SrfK [Mycolicibacterium fluoranthenivorans]
MRRVFRYVLVIAGIALMATTSAGVSGAAVAGTSTHLVSVSPKVGEVVGVAYPVTLSFDGPMSDRDAIERGIRFSVDTAADPSLAPAKVPAGSFAWLDDSTVRFTPSDYWPAHSTIAMSVGGFKTTFETGSQVVGVADISAHTFTVSIDGQVVREMPASMGKPKHPTPVGTFTALEKQNPVIMDSRTIGIPLSDPEGYKLTVNYAVRVTWGGVYVHSAPWSVGSQGNSNVSHGCINLSPDNAAWYYNNVSIGDPIIIQA